MINNLFEKLFARKNYVEIDSTEALKETKSADFPPWFKIALGELGIKEFAGENHNPRIIEYHKSCDLKAKTDEISWCSAFVNWCFLQSGFDYRTKSAAAISWRKWGNETNKPKIGDVVVFKRSDSEWRGHVAFYVAEDEKRILCLGGNQGDAVSFQWYNKRGNKLDLLCIRSIQ